MAEGDIKRVENVKEHSTHQPSDIYRGICPNLYSLVKGVTCHSFNGRICPYNG